MTPIVTAHRSALCRAELPRLFENNLMRLRKKPELRVLSKRMMAISESGQGRHAGSIVIASVAA
jgi:hypothetical protein